MSNRFLLALTLKHAYYNYIKFKYAGINKNMGVLCFCSTTPDFCAEMVWFLKKYWAFAIRKPKSTINFCKKNPGIVSYFIILIYWHNLARMLWIWHNRSTQRITTKCFCGKLLLLYILILNPIVVSIAHFFM